MLFKRGCTNVLFHVVAAMSSPLNPKLATGIVENFRSDYDTRFTADISKQMQMPDRLGAVDNAYDRFSQPLSHLHDGLLPSHGEIKDL